MRSAASGVLRSGTPSDVMNTGRDWSLLKEDTSMEGVAGCALYLLSPIGRSRSSRSATSEPAASFSM